MGATRSYAFVVAQGRLRDEFPGGREMGLSGLECEGSDFFRRLSPGFREEESTGGPSVAAVRRKTVRFARVLLQTVGMPVRPNPIRWVLSCFQFSGRTPHLREVPLLLLKCGVWGFLTGPLCTAFFMLIGGHNPLVLVRDPVVLLWSCATGVVWALTFYIFLGLGNTWLKAKLAGYPCAIAKTISAVYSIAASSFSFVLAVSINKWMGGTVIRMEMHYFWQVVLLDGIIGGILALVIGAFIQLKGQVQKAQAELSLKEIETARAQALALQSQINPHFFFNTLNTISALVDDDPATAKRMIGSLSDMFRYTLGCTQAESVPLDQELRFVRDYLAIEQARFRKRLRVELPEGPMPDVRVPGLVLQPLVENAVKHGIARRIEGGLISVRVAQGADRTRVSVRNTADDPDPGEPERLYRHGHALENVRARLRLFTGRQEPLSVAWNPEWTEFSFEI